MTDSIPEHIRCDNGPELISKALRKWLAKAGTQIQHIALGSPWENGHCESFNGKLRDVCLRRKIFYWHKEAQAMIALWQNTYNRVRLRSSLGYRPPAPVSGPDLAFRLPVATAMQEPLTRLGPKYRSGHGVLAFGRHGLGGSKATRCASLSISPRRIGGTKRRLHEMVQVTIDISIEAFIDHFKLLPRPDVICSSATSLTGIATPGPGRSATAGSTGRRLPIRSNPTPSR